MKELEKTSEPSALRDQICKSIFQGYRLGEPKPDLEAQTLTEIERAITKLGIDYDSLKTQRGVAAYNSRFDFSLVGLVFLAHNAAKITRFPQFTEFNRDELNYYLKNPDVVKRMREKWEKIRDTTGVITPLSIVKNSKSIEAQIDDYLEYGVRIDPYSEENKYPRLLAVISALSLQSGSIVEFGTGAADNLVALKDAAKKLVGNDLVPIGEFVDNPMLHQYRWHGNQNAIQPHLERVRGANIDFVVGNMFDREVVGRVFSNLPKPALAMFLNVLIHYHSTKAAEMIDLVLSHNPEFIVIGGSYPGLEEEFDGNPVPGRHSKIFKTGPNHVQTIAHIVDQNLPK